MAMSAQQVGEAPSRDPCEPSSWPTQGFLHLAGVTTVARCAELALHSEGVVGGAGARDLLDHAWCRELAGELRRSATLAPVLPDGHVAVQCNLFRKSSICNWKVALHQDLSIPVAARLDAVGWGGWSLKDGVNFVQPPVPVLEQLVALRLHLDDCGSDDGPLSVVPGSHRHGRLDADASRSLHKQSGLSTCLAQRGDALVLRPLLLHASSKSSGSSQRRVLHFVFGPRELPQGMRWHTVA